MIGCVIASVIVPTYGVVPLPRIAFELRVLLRDQYVLVRAMH